MRLRSRAIGFGETFYPFKRLPIELRHMIWRFTLEPRVVEVWWKSTRPVNKSAHDRTDMALEFTFLGPDVTDEESSLGPADEVRYYSPAALPTALRVCYDSRDAVKTLYPLCFASKTHGPGVRFNFSLDTPYLGSNFDTRAYNTVSVRLYRPFDLRIFGFLDCLSPMELACLENIAISALAGICAIEDDLLDAKYWEKLGALLERVTGLKNILTVHEVAPALNNLSNDCFYHNTARSLLLKRAADECSYVLNDRCMELHNGFPAELVQRFQIPAEDIPDPRLGWVHRRHSDWVDKRKRPIWGFRGAKYLTPIF